MNSVPSEECVISSHSHRAPSARGGHRSCRPERSFNLDTSRKCVYLSKDGTLCRQEVDLVQIGLNPVRSHRAHQRKRRSAAANRGTSSLDGDSSLNPKLSPIELCRQEVDLVLAGLNLVRPHRTLGVWRVGRHVLRRKRIVPQAVTLKIAPSPWPVAVSRK